MKQKKQTKQKSKCEVSEASASDHSHKGVKRKTQKQGKHPDSESEGLRREESPVVFGPQKPEIGTKEMAVAPAKPILGPEKPDQQNAGHSSMLTRLASQRVTAALGLESGSGTNRAPHSGLRAYIQSSEQEHMQADRNVSLWLGQGKAGPSDSNLPTSSGDKPGAGRGKARMFDRGFVFGRRRR